MDTNITTPIADLLPHDPPMVLLDRLVEADEQEALCEVTVTDQSLFLEPEGVPAYVGVEYMAQAVAAHAGYLALKRGGKVKVGFLLGTPRMTSHKPYFPKDRTLQIRVALDWGDNELMRFKCRITDRADDTLYQEAGLNVFQPEKLESYLSENGANRSPEGA